MLATMLRNPQHLLNQVVANVIMPDPPVNYVKWAENNIIFGKQDPFPGPYDFNKFPFWRRPLEVLQSNHPTREITLKKSAQIGGTILSQVFLGGSMDLAPSNFLYVHPTNDNAARWSKMKWKDFVAGTPVLKSIFPSRAKEGKDSTYFKELKSGEGSLVISGANSSASLSMITVPRQVQDDLSKWQDNDAGDPEKQADARSFAYKYAKILKCSTALVMPGCRITNSYLRGTQEKFHIACPHCGHKQSLDWENFKNNIDEDHPENSFFTCVENGCVIEEKDRAKICLEGEWVAKFPEREYFHVSFYIWSAYSPLASWEHIARKWLEAKGYPAAEQAFMNDVVGESIEAINMAPPWEALFERGETSDYSVGQIPNGALIYTIGVDCQADRTEWNLIGWGRNKQRYVIEYGIIPHHIETDECRNALNILLRRKWRNRYGREFIVDGLGIDGNTYTEDVFDFVTKHNTGRVIMLRGQGGDGTPLFKAVKQEVDRHGVLKKKKPWANRFYNMGVNRLKMYLYRNLEKLDPLLRGYIHFARGLTEDYYQQLTSENRIEKTRQDGSKYYIWVVDSKTRNEVLDTMNMAESMAFKLGVFGMSDEQWDIVAADREKPPDNFQIDVEDLLGVVPQVPKPKTEEINDSRHDNSSGGYFDSSRGDSGSYF